MGDTLADGSSLHVGSLGRWKHWRERWSENREGEERGRQLFCESSPLLKTMGLRSRSHLPQSGGPMAKIPESTRIVHNKDGGGGTHLAVLGDASPEKDGFHSAGCFSIFPTPFNKPEENCRSPRTLESHLLKANLWFPE